MVPKSETRAQKFRNDDGSLLQLLQPKLVFGSYSGTLLKPGNFRHLACPGYPGLQLYYLFLVILGNGRLFLTTLHIVEVTKWQLAIR